MKERTFSLQEIAEQLQRICHAHETGTAYIITADNASVKIVIQSGEMAAIHFRSKTNQEAIPLLSSIQQGRYTFLKGLVDMKGITAAHLDTQTILAQWRSGTAPDVRSAPPMTPPTGSTKPTFNSPANSLSTTSPVGNNSTSLFHRQPVIATNGQLITIASLIEQELIKFVGPCASIICQDYFTQLECSNASTDLNGILDQVSVDISDPIKRLKFKQTIQTELKQQGVV